MAQKFDLVDFFAVIAKEHADAIEKHPVFCSQLCDISAGSYERLANTLKATNDEDEARGGAYGDNVVMEEIYEMFVAANENDVDAMIKEAAQACQTIFRAVTFKIREQQCHKVSMN